MKKNAITMVTIFVMLFAFLPQQTVAQPLFGIRGGLNIANFTGEDSENMEPVFGLTGGGFMYMPLSSDFAIQPEILYVQRGTLSATSFAGVEGEVTLSLDYLTVPLQLVYTIDEVINFYAGAGIQFYLTGKAEAAVEGGEFLGLDFNQSGEADIPGDNVESPGYFLTFGFGYRSGPLQLDFKYERGLNQVGNFAGSEPEVYHSDLGILIGYYFNINTW